MMLEKVSTPIFIVFERAHDLFSKLHDSATILCRHQKYLTGSKLCIILESREHLNRIAYPAICPYPVQMHLPEYTKSELNSILLKDKPADCSDTLYHNYLQVILGYFYLSTHDIRVLKYITAQHFEAYRKPVVEGLASDNSRLLLWKRIEPTFREARESLFLKVDTKKKDTTLELPYYSKYLLISAYLASYNQPKTDKERAR